MSRGESWLPFFDTTKTRYLPSRNTPTNALRNFIQLYNFHDQRFFMLLHDMCSQLSFV